MVNQIAKYTTFLILIILFIFGIYWLWQRQPKPQNLQTPQTINTKTQNPQDQQNSDLKPVDFSVLTTNKVKIEGKTTPNSLVAIFSNDISAIAKSENSGNFQAEVILAKGLNLIDLSIISQEFRQEQKRTLTLYVSDNKNDGSTVYVGPVKTIFDTLLTASTTNGEKSIQASQSTDVDLPPPPNGEKEDVSTPPLKNIRIGDYIIVLGDLTLDAQDEKLQAKKIDVIRENIPQNTRKLVLAKTLTTARQNLFSTKNSTDNQIIELTLNKNSQISLDGKETKSTDITKGKNAIIIFHLDNNKNIADLVYLLP